MSGQAEPVTPDLHALLGDFKTDLWLPRYGPGTAGAWSLRQFPMFSTRGYWGDLYNVRGCLMLYGPPGQNNELTSWMSISPLEIESQEAGIRAACGHAVVVGLGMGWLAANVALNPEVQAVTIVESDPQVIAFASAHGVFAQLPENARGKIDIVQADAFEWKPRAAADCLLVDIWPALLDTRKLDDARRIQRNVGAAAIHYWGQEADMWRIARRSGINEADFDRATLEHIVVKAIGLPLILSGEADYVAKIAQGARWWGGGAEDWWRD